MFEVPENIESGGPPTRGTGQAGPVLQHSHPRVPPACAAGPSDLIPSYERLSSVEFSETTPVDTKSYMKRVYF